MHPELATPTRFLETVQFCPALAKRKRRGAQAIENQEKFVGVKSKPEAKIRQRGRFAKLHHFANSVRDGTDN
jgi:hypothetical protein